MTVTELQQCTDSIDERKLIDYRYAYVRMNQDEDEARLDYKILVPPATNSEFRQLFSPSPNSKCERQVKVEVELCVNFNHLIMRMR